MAPENLRYTKTHEWVNVGGEKAKFGLTDFAVGQIKDIVFLDLPAAGTAVKAGEAFGAVETVKAAFDLYAPVSGTVTSVNPGLEAHPEQVSKDPFGSGWLVEIALGSEAARETAALMDSQAYKAHCEKEAAH